MKHFLQQSSIDLSKKAGSLLPLSPISGSVCLRWEPAGPPDFGSVPLGRVMEQLFIHEENWLSP